MTKNEKIRCYWIVTYVKENLLGNTGRNPSSGRRINRLKKQKQAGGKRNAAFWADWRAFGA